MKRTSTMLMIGILALILFGAYSGYLYFKRASSESELKQVEASLVEYQNEMLKYQNKDVLEAINAKKTLADLNKDIIKWSKVIKKIRKTIPSVDNVPLIEVLSYSGSSSNEISMNVKTYPERDAPYFDVADLIEAFDNSEFFVDSFVPSISAGVDEKGNKILTFVFGTKYVEETPLEIIDNETSSEEEAIGVERDASAEGEVPVEGDKPADLGTAIDEVLTDSIVR